MTPEFLSSPLPLIFLTTLAVLLVARKLTGGGASLPTNADILQRLSKLEREVQQLKQAGGFTAADGAEAPDSSDMAAEARQIARSQGAIQAIKYVRERTGWGLKEAKDYVERL